MKHVIIKLLISFFVLLQICCSNLALALPSNNEQSKNLEANLETSIANTFDYKKQSISFWKKHLHPDVYKVCRDRGTEKAHSGKYDKFYEAGTYYCACCGGTYALFSSKTKFDSGTGWPSFWAPISNDCITFQEDNRITSHIFGARNEILCARCGSHLGHLFDDGPKEHDHKRYCINSVALVFVPEGKKPTPTYSVYDDK